MIINMMQESYVNLFLITFNSEFSYTEVWFTDHNYKLLGMEGKIGITLLIS